MVDPGHEVPKLMALFHEIEDTALVTSGLVERVTR
jgi:hypothetical protein